jgi:hypothetical protein
MRSKAVVRAAVLLATVSATSPERSLRTTE